MIQKIKLSKSLSYTLRSMPRGKKYPQPIANTCDLPFTHVSIDQNSDCFLCKCEGWLPIPVGKVSDFRTLDELWNSPIALTLQKDIKDKKFSWCAVSHCGVVDKSIANNKYSMSINIDDSCNLACPSCRRELYMLQAGPEFEKKTNDINHILEWLDKFNQPIGISLGGTGDALASQLIRNLIKNYRYKNGQTFIISTNGLLLKKIIPNSSIEPAISHFNISIDAGSQEVYEKVRRPGKWSVLMENLEWLFENKKQSNVDLNFVLQKENFRDIPAFLELCKKFNFDGNIMPLNDWGTWNSKPVPTPDAYTILNGTYIDHDVANPSHPEYAECMKMLNESREKKYTFLKISPYFSKLQ